MKLTGKITVGAENERTRKSLTMLITERKDIKPLLGMDWLREINKTPLKIESTTTKMDQSEKDNKFTKLFKRNQTINDTEIKIQLKPGHPPTKQKTRPILCHLQSYVETQTNKLFQS